MARAQGLEPQLTDPKSAVLPLDDARISGLGKFPGIASSEQINDNTQFWKIQTKFK